MQSIVDVARDRSMFRGIPNEAGSRVENPVRAHQDQAAEVKLFGNKCISRGLRNSWQN